MGGARRSSRTLAATSAALTSPSPTSTACAPASTTRRTSSAVKNPLSLTTIGPGGICGSSASVVSRRVSNVARSRLLMPITRAPIVSAVSSSPAVWHSTSGESPSPLAAAARSRSCAASRMLTISSTASAPAARASHSWYSSSVKSLRSTGTSTAVRTAARSPRLPRKYFASVSTEMASTPCCAYVVASATGSRSAFSTPREGDARLTSAMRRAHPGTGASARSKSRGGDSVAHVATSALRGVAACRSAISCRLCRTISSRIDIAGGSEVPALALPAQRVERHRTELLEHVVANGSWRRQITRRPSVLQQRLEQLVPRAVARGRSARAARHDDGLERPTATIDVLGAGPFTALGHRPPFDLHDVERKAHDRRIRDRRADAVRIDDGIEMEDLVLVDPARGDDLHVIEPAQVELPAHLLHDAIEVAAA